MDKKIFDRYEKVRLSGVTNMFNVKTISKLAMVSLEDVLYIMDNYNKLNKKYGSDYGKGNDGYKFMTKIMSLGKTQEKGISNKLDKNSIDTILCIMEYFGATDIWLKQTFFDLQLAKYKLYDWLAMCIMSRNNDDRDTNNTALKVLVYAYLKVNGNVDSFINDLRETDYDMDTDWKTIEI